MIGRSALFALSVSALACSGGNDRQTNRNLGPSARDGSADADEGEGAEADAETGQEHDADAVESDASPVEAGLDAGAVDASEERDVGNVSDAVSGLDTGAPDAPLPDTGASADADGVALDTGAADAQPDADDPPPGTYRIRVDVANPHQHTNEIRFAWGSSPVELANGGYVYGTANSDQLDVIMGESDETTIVSIQGVQSGDRLRFLYRNFHEDRIWRRVVLPAGPLPEGTLSVQAGNASFQGGTTDFTYAYAAGPMSYLAFAQGAGTGTPVTLGYAFARQVPASTTDPATLGPWAMPHALTLALSNMPSEADTRTTETHVILRNADGPEEAGRTAQGAWAIPLGYAENIEARLSSRQKENPDVERYVEQVLLRCGPDSVSEVALDYADALPLITSTPTNLGSTLRWDLTTPSAAQGDLLIVDGVLMPATRTSIDVPAGNGHYVARIDFASVSDYAGFKRNIRLDLDNLTTPEKLLKAHWCQGTDYVRISLVEIFP